ncbi:hypothetical protein ABIE53_002001 [Burkholderia sp. OAS925]
MRLAMHGLLALLAIGDPRAAVLQLARGLPFAGHFDEQFERRLRIRHDAEVRTEHAADLRRLDIDVHELAALRVDIDAARVTVRPAVADAEHEVGREHRRVAVAVRGLQTDHAGHQRMVVGNRAPRHQRRDHRHADGFRELHEQVLGGCVQHAAAGDDQRLLGIVEQRERGLDLLARRLRLVDRQRFVGVDIEFDFGELHVDRQIDQHRTGAARAHQMERLLEHARHERRLAHRHRPLGDGLGDRLDVDGLEVFLVETRARRLARDGQNRNRVGLGGVETGDHVGARGTRRADTHADVAGLRPRIAFGHVRRALDVTREHVADVAGLAHRRVERVDGGARHAERGVDTFFFEHQHGGVDGSHLGHECLLNVLGNGD